MIRCPDCTAKWGVRLERKRAAFAEVMSKQEMNGNRVGQVVFSGRTARFQADPSIRPTYNGLKKIERKKFSWAEKEKWIDQSGPSQRKRFRKFWQPKSTQPDKPKFLTKEKEKGAERGDESFKLSKERVARVPESERMEASIGLSGDEDDVEADMDEGTYVDSVIS